MSGKVAGAIFDLGRYEGATLLVALALAEYADDDGGEIFPKVATLAAKARISERMAQYALKTLRDDNVLVTVKEARRGRPAVYKIDLVRVQWLRCNGCGAIDDSVGVQNATVGVQPVAPPIEEPPVEPSEEAPHRARVPRQREMLLPFGGRRRAAAPDEELLFAEFRRVPGYSRAWGLADVLAGLDALGEDRPPTAFLIAAVRGYARFLDERNSARGPRDGRHPMSRPSNWLARREFEGFLQQPEQSVMRIREPDPSWADWRERAVACFGAEVFETWLAPTTLHIGDAFVTVAAARPFIRNWISARYAAALERLFGREVRVTVKTERAA